ncbi:hypothetical protein [Flavihumibacter sp. CACIAM 22H1]|uniref:hypothetical protein n=1 Tax=Flavihumibacter sp. CACIAM 22H1 TaxID=1812911 RepID=UPI0007A82895|nr:hypothetical protein [Flavihumibacter sp. CACIAM 22H1]KYP15655.1 MAG: hypothetical protein A1D16_10850 [Flavihumibacter sp. CACIAM 22H1]
MLKTVLLLLLAYIAYKFIVGFVIPVTRATRSVRRQFKAAQEEMEARMQQQGQYQPNNSTGSPNASHSQRPAPSKGDYIEFEEVRGE